MIFSNKETELISKWYRTEIDIILSETNIKERIELISIVSEKVEEMIMKDLLHITEGYVSEIIHISFEEINYNELIDFYRR